MVVNDGSPNSFNHIFSQISQKSTLLHNAINLGKGAALKHGINYILTHHSDTKAIITLDCDGQHTIDDVLKIKDQFHTKQNIDLIIGVREFNNNIPIRSKIGNKATRSIFKIMFGKTIQDTQSGLRAFNIEFAKSILSIPYNGYEFEMQMLILACNKDMTIMQVPIHTIYINNNASSHFNPIFDSLSIYFVLFRHIGNSLLTAAIDYIVFVLAFSLGFGLLTCMISGRIIAGSFNFIVGKTLVFKTKSNLKFEIISYSILTIILMLISMQGIKFISHYSGISEIVIKPICELMIFAISFLVQRFFIFISKAQILDMNTQNQIGGGINEKYLKATNWEKYYNNRKKDKGFKISNLTRKISTKIILNLLKNQKHINQICEFGGGDSCFYLAFRKKYKDAKYIVFDNSNNGIDLFNAKYKNKNPYKQYAQLKNILKSKFQDEQFDLVFSVGLIEHFNKEGTKMMITKHFEALKSGGIVLITYPTPTLLYRFTRFILERLGAWEFFDERALLFNEVHNTCKDFGELIDRKLNIAIILTQEIVVYKKY